MYYESKKKLLMSSGGYAAQYFTIVIESDGEDQMLCFGVKGHTLYKTPITITKKVDGLNDIVKYLYKGSSSVGEEVSLIGLKFENGGDDLVKKEDAISFEYSINGSSWRLVEQYKPHIITGLKKRDKIRIKSFGQMMHFICSIPGEHADYLNKNDQFDGKNILDNHVKTYSIQGNIMSLYWGDKFRGKTTFDEKKSLIPIKYKFIDKNITISGDIKCAKTEDEDVLKDKILPCRFLFINNLSYDTYNLSLISAENLCFPAKTLGDYEYFEIFHNCDALIKPPKLISAVTLGKRACEAMFANCTNMTEAPKLNFKKLDEYCCSSMFINCWNLLKCPSLPATELAKNCYEYMFAYCVLMELPETLPATTLTQECYKFMFCLASTSDAFLNTGSGYKKNNYITNDTGNLMRLQANKMPKIVIDSFSGTSSCRGMFAGQNLYIPSSGIICNCAFNESCFSHAFISTNLFYSDKDIPSKPKNSPGINIDANRVTAISGFDAYGANLCISTNKNMNQSVGFSSESCKHMFAGCNNSNNLTTIQHDKYGKLIPIYNFYVETSYIDKSACESMFEKSGIKSLSIVCDDKTYKTHTNSSSVNSNSLYYTYDQYNLFINESGCKSMCRSATSLKMLNFGFYPSQVYGFYSYPVPNHPYYESVFKRPVQGEKEDANKTKEIHHDPNVFCKNDTWKDSNTNIGPVNSAYIDTSYGMFDFTWGLNDIEYIPTNAENNSYIVYMKKANLFKIERKKQSFI